MDPLKEKNETFQDNFSTILLCIEKLFLFTFFVVYRGPELSGSEEIISDPDTEKNYADPSDPSRIQYLRLKVANY